MTCSQTNRPKMTPAHASSAQSNHWRRWVVGGRGIARLPPELLPVPLCRGAEREQLMLSRVLRYLDVRLTVQIHHFLRRRIDELLNARQFLHASRREQLGFLQFERSLFVGQLV